MSAEFSTLKEGDEYPSLGKRIKVLVFSNEDCFIFLDEEFFVQWETRDGFDTKPAAEILNKVSYLETISSTHFAGLPKENAELGEYRRLLGESLARALVGNINSAIELLDTAEDLLHERSTQRARQWYLWAAGCAAAIPSLGILVLWILRLPLREIFGSNGFEVLLCGLLGGLGALVSTIFSVRKINLNASFGRHIHYFEGVARIIAGTVGGALIGLAIKGNLIFGGLNSISDSSVRLAGLFSFALVAGTSERIVPNFIKKVEKATIAEPDARANDGTKRARSDAKAKS